MPPTPEGDRDLPDALIYKPKVWWDPVWMEFVLERAEGESRDQVISVALETTAAVFRAYADGAARTAQLFGSQAEG